MQCSEVRAVKRGIELVVTKAGELTGQHERDVHVKVAVEILAVVMLGRGQQIVEACRRPALEREGAAPGRSVQGQPRQSRIGGERFNSDPGQRDTPPRSSLTCMEESTYRT